MSTEVFSDSRGRFLEYELPIHLGLDVIVCHYPGGDRLYGKVWRYTLSHHMHRIYIMAGINDITKQNAYTGQCFPAYSNPNQLRNTMMEKYIALSAYCRTECNVDEVIICTMLGIGQRTTRSLSTSAISRIINQGVRLLNWDITSYIAAWDLHTPTIHQSIHTTMFYPYSH